MKDLTNPRWIKIKGISFLIIGMVSALLLVLENPNWKVIALLVICIWCFCRFYYFAFYVIEHYVDSSYRFSGLTAFLGYLVRHRRGAQRGPTEPKR
jgi:hypothetical protein